ncbi:LemA family protein [Chelatococcus asaccharovorans]|mgnify:CR=1 FL=1|uniref:LemA protein n=1 Tax=Chelatococcus asaccharovorans TaxID=28210 RepID=A0A2V3U686_9HYPH|nr:LemA family protein [Chelatococcus asaccharovorans]MBS7705725.1 LemA family protein [Chelatococcus asaccharovorans]PXW58743.1 LemA protein [Chelatococcus asaccharovorans]CAH1657329.1 LemA protein [Chelatococcus asaccharovorans]CAH1684827.1 LemA protein [Chelatococcus asaccharovorans]
MRSRAFISVVAVVMAVCFGAATVVFARNSAAEIPVRAENAVAAWSSVEKEFKARTAVVPAMVALAIRVEAPDKLRERIVTASEDIETLPPDPATPYSPDKLRAFMATQDALSDALGEVLDLVNAHPADAADPKVKALLAQLADHEQRMVVARSDYVEGAKAYNAELETMPNRWTVSYFHPDASPMVASFDFKK